MKSKENMKICFAASSGGHYEQLLMLRPLMDKYDSFIVTEQTLYDTSVEGKNSKEKPDIVITTGVMAMIPICMIAKLHKKKLVYIESFAKVSSPTKTGKLMYKYADRFYVQWESMLEIFPDAVCLGGIY